MKSNLHILLIDDDPDINFLNKMIIERYEVAATISETTCAGEALDLLNRGKLMPSIILLDLNMPELDGWQFIEQFEGLSAKLPDTKVIILSSSIKPSDKERASELKLVHDFWSKPLSPDKVNELKKIAS